MMNNQRHRIIPGILVMLIALSPFFGYGNVWASESYQTPKYTAEIAVSFPENGGSAAIKEKSGDTAPSPKIEKTDITVGDGGEGKFVIGYDEPGTYQYQISQTTTNKVKNVVYENAVYNVTLFIASKEDGTLYHEFAVFKGDNTKKEEKITFTNKKKEKKDVKKSTTGGKGGKGGGAKTGDESEIEKWSLITAAGTIMLIIVLRNRNRNSSVM